MGWAKESRERWKDGATIFSLLAVPVILAVGGWRIQERLSEEGLRRDYVQIALGILSQKPDPNDPNTIAMREWAAGMLVKYSPVDVPAELRKALEEEAIIVTARKRSWTGPLPNNTVFEIEPDDPAGGSSANAAEEPREGDSGEP